VSYHPGVLLTDLWRPPTSHGVATTSNNTDTSGAQLALPRIFCSCCVKHPKVSAAGLASLSDPRCHYLHHSCVRGVTVGHGGGYYQQACCCMVVPVRPLFSYNLSHPNPMLPLDAPPATQENGGGVNNYDASSAADSSLESLLWVASMRRLLESNPDMFTKVQNSLRELQDKSQNINSDAAKEMPSVHQKSWLLNPACACTEPLAMAPLCVCASCLC
jgi:hypothetical protein